MSRNRSRRANRKKPSSPRPAIQAVRSASPSPIAGSPPKRGFHIDWIQVNFWQFIILLLIPIVLTILYVFPILDKHRQLRPEATIIAGSFLTTIGIVYGVLSAGVFRIKKINPFHPKKFKPKQAVLAIISGILLSFLLLEIAMLPPPPKPIVHSISPLTTVPLLPFGGAPPI